MKAIIFFSLSLTYLDADIDEGGSVLKNVLGRAAVHQQQM